MTSKSSSQFYCLIQNYITEIHSTSHTLNNIKKIDLLPKHEIRRLKKCYSDTLSSLLNAFEMNQPNAEGYFNTPQDDDTLTIIMRVYEKNRLHVMTAKQLQRQYDSLHKDTSIVCALKGVVGKQKTAKYLLKKLTKMNNENLARETAQKSKLRPYNKTLTFEEKKMLMDSTASAEACSLIRNIRHVCFIAKHLEKQLQRQHHPGVIKLKSRICSYQGQAKRITVSMFPTCKDFVSKYEIKTFDVKSLSHLLHDQLQMCIELSNSLLGECLLITSNKIVYHKCRQLIYLQQCCIHLLKSSCVDL